MRANSDQRNALAFGALAEAYDAGRARLDGTFVRRMVRRAVGDEAVLSLPVLEIGAGSGQLTGGLLDCGCRVVALEPALELAALLESRYRPALVAGQLRVERSRLEEAADTLAPVSFGSVWAADSFHWLDPGVSYRVIAGLLRPAGPLIRTWSFPICADPELQRRLNAVFERVSPSLVREPDEYGEGPGSRLVKMLQDGVDELVDSGFFEREIHWLEHAIRPVPVEVYEALQCSYGHVAELSPGQRQAVREAIREALAGREELDVAVHRSVSVGVR